MYTYTSIFFILLIILLIFLSFKRLWCLTFPSTISKHMNYYVYTCIVAHLSLPNVPIRFTNSTTVAKHFSCRNATIVGTPLLQIARSTGDFPQDFPNKVTINFNRNTWNITWSSRTSVRQRKDSNGEYEAENFPPIVGRSRLSKARRIREERGEHDRTEQSECASELTRRAARK